MVNGTETPAMNAASNRLGLLLALAGFMTLSMGDGLVKSMAGQWPGTAVAALRYFIATIALGAIIAAMRGRAGFAIVRLDIQLARGAVVALSTLSFFLGTQLMPLADVTAIQFISPIFVALLSPLMVGERAPKVVWITTMIALLGVAIVLRPNLTALGMAAFLPVAAALTLALLVIFNRKMAGLADALSLQFWVAFLATPLLIGAAALGHLSGAESLRVDAPSTSAILKCAGVALTGTVAHWLLYIATEHASAPVIAPTVYVQLLLAVVIGWLVFGEGIDLISAGGMGLIIASGLILWRSQRNTDA